MSFFVSEAGGNEEERCAPLEPFCFRKPEEMRRKGAHSWSLFVSEAGGNEEERFAPFELFASEAGRT